MLHIGITYNPTIELFTSGSNQTAILLTELFQELGYNVSLISTKDSDNDWWVDFPRLNHTQTSHIQTSNIYTNNNLDYLIDIDGYLKSSYRKKLAKKSIVFLRTFLQFDEMDNSIYPEKLYRPRHFDDIQEIWCWDILNPSETIPSVQTLFSCPIRRIPFIWSSNVVSNYYNKDMAYNPNSTWNIHIAEKNTNNTSSSIIPLVALRELFLKNVVNATYKCHNMDKIIENRFLKENVLNNIEIEKLPVSFEKKEPFYNWLNSENNILFSHSRFLPIQTGLINAIWLGIPVVHNSPILKSIHPELEKMFYYGNEFSGITSAFTNFTSSPERYFDAVKQIRYNIETKWSIRAKLSEWKNVANVAFKQPISAPIPNKLNQIIVAFSDMWPGFNYDNNFIIDALRHNSTTTILGKEYNPEISPNLVIFGPYGDKWKEVPNTIPTVYFSAENWNIPQDDSIKLFLTSSRIEDNKYMRIPTWMMFIDWYSKSTMLPENCQDNPIRIPLHFATNSHPIPFNNRKEFCGFVVSNPVCNFRNETFNAINNYKHVNSGGALYNNIGGQLSLKYAGGGCGDISKYNFFSNHKFTISFENSQAPGYITEKVLHSKMAGCIPIYWGDSQTDTDFVPNSFVNISNITNPDKVVDVIKMLENNIKVCEHYASTPILDETKTKKAFDIIDRMAIRLLNLITDIEDTKMPTRIDKMFVVNLDTRPDRLESLFKEEPYLKNMITRIPAVNGKTLKLDNKIYELFKNNNFGWKKSAMGCSLSHINIWSSILKESGNYFMILEDDVRFKKDWLKDWNKYAENIPEDAELLYIGGVLPPNMSALPQCLQEINSYWSEIKPNTLFSQIPIPLFHFCTYSYIITRKGVEKILGFLRDSEMKSYAAVDHLLGSPVVNLKKYVSNPLLAFCFQDTDPVYINSQFNELHRKDKFDSDIWNNTECFNEDDFKPFIKKKDKLTFYCVNETNPENIYEKRWIKDMFQSEFSLSLLENFEMEVSDNSWFIVQRPYTESFCKYFQFLNNKNINFKVLHLSDEFSKDNIDFYTYSNCKAVIRNYWRADLPKLSHIVTIPLGYHYKCQSSKTFNDRQLIWSFHGTDWFNRRESLEKMYSLMPHHCHFTNTWNDPNQSNEGTYLGTLENSKFCPILRGNNIETFRLYEVLEIGTIPIYIRTTDDTEFWSIISSKLQLYELDSWEKAIKLINIFLNNPELAEKYRMSLLERWNIWKKQLQTICNSFI